MMRELERLEAGVREQGVAHRRELRRVEERLSEKLALVLELLGNGGAATAEDDAIDARALSFSAARQSNAGGRQNGGFGHLSLLSKRAAVRTSRGSKGTYIDQLIEPRLHSRYGRGVSFDRVAHSL